MACIQTLPGAEFDVAEDLKKACKSRPHILLKGFGSFDIILLYATPSFASGDLTKAGPISGIIKSNLFLCFPYLDDNSETIFDSLSRCTYVGLSLLKINPGVQDRIPQIERKLVRDLRNQGGDRKRGYVLGTLGWNELLLLVTGERIDIVFEELLSTSQRVTESEQTSLLIKTFSFIALNYQILRGYEKIAKARDFRQVKNVLDGSRALAHQTSQTNPPSIIVACKPIYTREIVLYWRRKQFAVQEVLGKDDIVVTPKKAMSWSYITSSLLYFRQQFSNKILTTNTCIRGMPSTGSQKNVDTHSSVPVFSFTFDDLERIFGEDSAYDLANHFYSLSGLAQNPIIGSAFRDMAAYPDYVIRTGEALKNGPDATSDLLAFETECSTVLRLGAELRSYGTHGAIEEVVGRFSKVRGGAQRSLLGVEFLPAYVLKKLMDEGWKGFVIAEAPKFFHINSVINVPTEALWNPQAWWALYHEIAHILIDNLGGWLSYEVPEIRQFLAKKEQPEHWMILLNELAAEVVGFELGFYNDFNLFVKLLWKYLKRVHPILDKSVDLETYAIRTFFVGLFENHFRLQTVSAREFQDTEFLYVQLLDHIDLIRRVTGIDDSPIFDDKHFIAAKNAYTFKELYNVAKYFFNKVSELTLLHHNTDELTNANTIKVKQSLEEKRIWWKAVRFPEAVLYHLFRKDDLTFGQSIATILTFWNLHMRFLRERRYGYTQSKRSKRAD